MSHWPDVRRRWLSGIALRIHVEFLALAVPVLVRVMPIQRFLAAMTPRRRISLYSGLRPADIARVVARRLRHPWVMRHTRCLRMGLISFHLMQLAGAPAVLHFAVYPFDTREHKAHCWVTVEGKCLTNEPERPFAVVLVHCGALPI